MTRFLRLAIAGAVALASAAPVLAQPDPSNELWRRLPPPCLDSWSVPGVVVSRGYRNPRVVKQLDTERVQVVAENSTGRYLLTFNLCREEIEDRELL